MVSVNTLLSLIGKDKNDPETQEIIKMLTEGTVNKDDIEIIAPMPEDIEPDRSNYFCLYDFKQFGISFEICVNQVVSVSFFTEGNNGSKGFKGMVCNGLSVNSTRENIVKTMGNSLFINDLWDHYTFNEKLNVSFLYWYDNDKLDAINFGDRIFFSSPDNLTRYSPIFQSLLNPPDDDL